MKQAAIWVGDFKAKVRREIADEAIGIRLEVTLSCQALLKEWLALHRGKQAKNVKSTLAWETRASYTCPGPYA